MKLGYARVSTEDQSLDLQIRALKEAGCKRIFTDHGISAVAAKRPGLIEALAHIREGDVLITWRLDRLARSLHDLMDISMTLHLKEAGLLSLRENIDTASASGRLVLHLFGAVAEFERNLIIERTKAGLAAAKARGSPVGRPRKLNDEKISEALLMLARGASLSEVARIYKVSLSTLYRYKSLQ
ncbi:MAG: recombinase family protein [Pseudomonadota bacterium]